MHNPKDDPYDPNWRRTLGRLRVEIRLETTGVSPQGLIEMHDCLRDGVMFIIHNGSNSMIAFYPDRLQSMQKVMGLPDVWSSFTDFQQMVDNLKLCLFEHNQVVSSARVLDDVTPKLLNNDND